MPYSRMYSPAMQTEWWTPVSSLVEDARVPGLKMGKKVTHVYKREETINEIIIQYIPF